MVYPRALWMLGSMEKQTDSSILESRAGEV